MRDPTRIRTPAMPTVVNSTTPKPPDPAKKYITTVGQKRLAQPEARRIAGAIIQGKPKLDVF
jgi:hypothetical protein